jgi:hypothetical protein
MKPNKLSRYRSDPLPPSAPPRRVYPSRGQPLTMACIRGPWRPSGAAAGAGVFSVVWSTRNGDFWAPLHDFNQLDQLRLIDECRRVDRMAYGDRPERSGGVAP